MAARHACHSPTTVPIPRTSVLPLWLLCSAAAAAAFSAAASLRAASSCSRRSAKSPSSFWLADRWYNHSFSCLQRTSGVVC